MTADNPTLQLASGDVAEVIGYNAGVPNLVLNVKIRNKVYKQQVVHLSQQTGMMTQKFVGDCTVSMPVTGYSFNSREQLLHKMTQEIKNIKKKSDEFKRSNNIDSFETERESIINYTREVKSIINKINLDKLKIQATLLRIKRTQNQNIFFVEEVVNFGNVQEYRKKIASLKHIRKKLELQYLERHPNIIANLAELREYESVLDDEVKMAIKTLEQKVANINERELQLNVELRKIKEQSDKLDSIEGQYNIIYNQYQSKTALRDAFLKRINEIANSSVADDSTNFLINFRIIRGVTSGSVTIDGKTRR